MQNHYSLQCEELQIISTKLLYNTAYIPNIVMGRIKHSGFPVPPPVRRRRVAAGWLTLGFLFLNILVSTFLPGAAAREPDVVYNPNLSENVIVLCTPNGLKTVRLDAEGIPIEDEKADSSYCVYCLPLCKPLVQASIVENPVSLSEFIFTKRPLPRKIDPAVPYRDATPANPRAPPLPLI